MRVNAVSVQRLPMTKRPLCECATSYGWRLQPVAEIFSNLHANEWCETVMNYVIESHVCLCVCVQDVCMPGQQGL